MLEVFKFILKCVLDFLSMLFSIDVGFTNLGVVMCICYILFPMILVLVNFLKSSVIEELDQRYDESRPIETLTVSRSKNINGWHVNHSVRERRRLR